MSSNPKSTRESAEIDELMHKLGYPDRPAQDRKEEIKANMRDLKKWLDDDDGPSTKDSALSDSKVASCHVDHSMKRPAVLIASTGSIRKKKKMLAASSPAQHLVPSNNTGHLGSVKYEPRMVNARPEGLETFPPLDCTLSLLERGAGRDSAGSKTDVPKL
jgi:hypothetical protein